MALIENGNLRLGVNPEGFLCTEADGSPFPEHYITTDPSLPADGVGLTYLPTGAEALAWRYMGEGWGLLDMIAFGGSFLSPVTDCSVYWGTNLAVLESFVVTASTAVSTVRAHNWFRVIHDWQPYDDDTYRCAVTIRNIAGAPKRARYRRVADFDVEPTKWNEYATLAGADTPEVLVLSNDGFMDPNPKASTSTPLGTGLFSRHDGDGEDIGPYDQGYQLDLGDYPLDSGEEVSFNLYYGCAASKAAAVALLTETLGAKAYALAYPSTDTSGSPNCFFFAYGEGEIEPPQPPVPPIRRHAYGTVIG